MKVWECFWANKKNICVNSNFLQQGKYIKWIKYLIICTFHYSKWCCVWRPLLSATIWNHKIAYSTTDSNVIGEMLRTCFWIIMPYRMFEASPKSKVAWIEICGPRMPRITKRTHSPVKWFLRASITHWLMCGRAPIYNLICVPKSLTC